DVDGRALVVSDDDTGDDDLSSEVISRGRLVQSFDLDVGCVAVDLPVVRLWPMGDCIVVRSDSFRHLCYIPLTKSDITAIASFHDIHISARWRRLAMVEALHVYTYAIPSGFTSVASLRLKDSKLVIVAEAHQISYSS
ncbi:hypothetical protein PAXRUDRAFT_100827, partial [Paxillus rubicundulus Ve08.2h10]